MLRQKYEELYSLVAQWALALSTQSIPYSAAMQGKITYDQANDMFISGNSGRVFDFDKIELFIDAYAPSCREAFDTCIKHRSEMNRVHADFRTQYDSEGPNGTYRQLGPYTDAVVSFERGAEALKANVVREIRKLSEHAN